MSPLLLSCLSMEPADAEKFEPHPAEPSTTAPAPPEPDLTPGSAELHVQRGLERAPDFHAFVEGPWVVFGDGSEKQVRDRAGGTVRWANRLLVQDFFPVAPPEPVDVWLFKDPESYQRHTRAWLDDVPDTPYGFANEQGLFMDISTGGGTLVHEMVHPLMAVNFPGCPPWFNEGLASLYEAVGERDGHLVGHVNWRLDGLQEQIQAKALPSFEVLMAQDAEGFYNHDTADNYGQARYLLYHLQERGLLRPFYAAFTAHVDGDPTGFETLKQVLGRDDMEVFQAEWEAWVLTLSR